MLEATSGLRLTQEEENQLYETLLSQQDKLEESERDLVVLQQNLRDAESSYGNQTSANELFGSLRRDFQRLLEEQQSLELQVQEKVKKIHLQEQCLQEPVPSRERV